VPNVTPTLSMSDRTVYTLRPDGTVKCWGQDLTGTDGDDADTGFSASAVQVHGVAGATAASVGCAILTGGALQCWGLPYRFARGMAAGILGPTPVTGFSSGTLAVSAGDQMVCAVQASGGVECWGSNQYGALGSGSAAASSTAPVPVTGLSSGVTSVSVASSTACALTTGGSVQCWGHNANGELGNASKTDSSVPVQVTGLTSGVIAVSTGHDSACAVTAAGAVVCWGDNASGQLGNGTNADSSIPVPVSGLMSGATAVSVGWDQACAVVAGGVVCWGDNGYGQLGNDSTTSSLVPVPVANFTSGAIGVATGLETSCAIEADGSVSCWGRGSSGTNGDLGFNNVVRPVPVDDLDR
jgi:alpha-tubulin suppressor-like RCC1 family protein